MNPSRHKRRIQLQISSFSLFQGFQIEVYTGRHCHSVKIGCQRARKYRKRHFRSRRIIKKTNKQTKNGLVKRRMSKRLTLFSSVFFLGLLLFQKLEYARHAGVRGHLVLRVSCKSHQTIITTWNQNFISKRRDDFYPPIRDRYRWLDFRSWCLAANRMISNCDRPDNR